MRRNRFSLTLAFALLAGPAIARGDDTPPDSAEVEVEFRTAVPLEQGDVSGEAEGWLKAPTFHDHHAPRGRPGFIPLGREVLPQHRIARLPPDQLQQTVDFYLYIDEEENALEVLQHVYEKTKRPFDGMQLAILADTIERTELRDATLRAVAETNDPPDDAKAYVEFAALLRQALAAEGEPRLDPATVDALAKRGSTGHPTFVWYAAGMFLANRGVKDDADRYLQLAASSPRWIESCVVLAWETLRERGVEIGPRRFVEIPGSELSEPEYMYSRE